LQAGNVYGSTIVFPRFPDNITSLFVRSVSSVNEIEIRNNSGGGQNYFKAGNGYLAFGAESSEQMRLTSTGLGIGTSTIQGKLSIQGDVYTRGGGVYYVQNNDNTNNYYLQNSGATGAANGNLNFVQGGVAVRATLDSSGNLGLGVTPSAWGNGVSLQGNAWALSTTSGFDSLALAANARQTAYGNGSQNYVYRGTAPASNYEQAAGNHRWYTAPSGTAGNAISFTQAMTLDASGNLLVGLTSSLDNNWDIQINTPASGVRGMGVNDNGGYGVYLTYDKTVRYGTDAAAIRNIANSPLVFETNNTERARIPAAGGMVIGTAALATNATDGFLYVPTCAGTPTGTPTTQTGTAPIVINTTNNKLYFYSGGAWRDAGP
jgi:hypothetical protein